MNIAKKIDTYQNYHLQMTPTSQQIPCAYIFKEDTNFTNFHESISYDTPYRTKHKHKSSSLYRFETCL